MGQPFITGCPLYHKYSKKEMKMYQQYSQKLSKIKVETHYNYYHWSPAEMGTTTLELAAAMSSIFGATNLVNDQYLDIFILLEIIVSFNVLIITSLGTDGPYPNNGDSKRPKGISPTIGEYALAHSQLPLSRWLRTCCS